jgi:hypothetical protein
MSASWVPLETNTHQDHVIAHVLGTSVLAYFVFEEAVHLLLDIGFVWTIFLDGEMGLVPHPVAIGELEAEPDLKNELRRDVDLLLTGNSEAENLLRMRVVPLHTEGAQTEITDVTFFHNADRRRLVLDCEATSLVIESSLATRDFKVMNMSKDDPKDDETELADVAKTEHEYLHERLRQELGREPTEQELDDWLRQHTEGY